MKKLLFFLILSLLSTTITNSQNMEKSDNSYILTEIWNAKPAWLALSQEQRTTFFNEKINPLLMRTLQGGAEIIGCAINDNTGNERMNYQFMAVWKFKDKESSDQLEKRAKEAGFLDYFEQINFSGNLIPPPLLNENMIKL